jgi:hypothetical protein
MAYKEYGRWSMTVADELTGFAKKRRRGDKGENDGGVVKALDSVFGSLFQPAVSMIDPREFHPNPDSAS